MQQVPIDHIKRDIGSGMAKMTFATNRRPAYIHAHMTGGNRNENFFLPAVRIINFQITHNIDKLCAISCRLFAELWQKIDAKVMVISLCYVIEAKDPEHGQKILFLYQRPAYNDRNSF